MKRFLVNENNVIWCKTVQLLIGGSLLLLSPQNVFAAPNDFDGDGKSDFAVARQFDPGAAGDPCKALAIPVWANCNTNVRLYQNTFFIKSSSSNNTEVISLLTSESEAHRSREVMTTELDSGGRAVPQVISFNRGLKHYPDRDFLINTDSVTRGEDGGYYPSSTPSFARSLMYSFKEIGDSFDNEHGSSSSELLTVDRFRFNTYHERVAAILVRSYDNGGNVSNIVFNLSNLIENHPLEELTMEYGIPVIADYSGDGTDEIAVFTPFGDWVIRDLKTKSTQTIQWGLPRDHPMPGDYDGDGKADLAVFRPSTAMWYILTSSSGYDKSSATVVQFGLPPYSVQIDENSYYVLRDFPIHADFDGDGKLDVAVYRMSNGTWYYLESSSNQIKAVQWGLPNDLPIGAGISDRMYYTY